MRRPILMIVLLLLLLNAASLYWFTQRAPATSDSVSPAPKTEPVGATRLKLLAEVPPEELMSAAAEEPRRSKPTAAAEPVEPPATKIETASHAPEPAPTTPPARTSYCFTTPPFATEAGDDAVLRTLAHIPDVEVNMAPEPVTESTTYWVRLKGFRALKEATALLKELREKGIKDVATTPVKDRGMVVSLGLYRFAQSAKDRVHEIEGMGYDPEIVELKKTHTGLRYRINILAASERQARAYLGEYRKAFPDHPPQLQDCAE